jgi:hypothetical protein
MTRATQFDAIAIVCLVIQLAIKSKEIPSKAFRIGRALVGQRCRVLENLLGKALNHIPRTEFHAPLIN